MKSIFLAFGAAIGINSRLIEIKRNYESRE
jgi:hypothetical protein